MVKVNFSMFILKCKNKTILINERSLVDNIFQVVIFVSSERKQHKRNKKEKKKLKQLSQSDELSSNWWFIIIFLNTFCKKKKSNPYIIKFIDSN